MSVELTTSRRELALACLLALLGAALVLVAVGRRWHGASTGEQLVPLVRAVGFVALAGVVALLAARGWVRWTVGVLLAVGGVAIVVSAAGEIGAADVAFWPMLTVFGGLLVLAAGLLAVVRARSWPALGARYEAPVAKREVSAGDAWDALDRGEDPTSDETAPRD